MTSEAIRVRLRPEGGGPQQRYTKHNDATSHVTHLRNQVISPRIWVNEYAKSGQREC